jgi:hypothetical protein
MSRRCARCAASGSRTRTAAGPAHHARPMFGRSPARRGRCRAPCRTLPWRQNAWRESAPDGDANKLRTHSRATTAWPARVAVPLVEAAEAGDGDDVGADTGDHGRDRRADDGARLRLAQQALHFAHGLAQADEDRPADDRVPDVQLADAKQLRDRLHVEVVERVPGIETHAEHGERRRRRRESSRVRRAPPGFRHPFPGCRKHAHRAGVDLADARADACRRFHLRRVGVDEDAADDAGVGQAATDWRSAGSPGPGCRARLRSSLRAGLRAPASPSAA